jgi:hypothetical protein
VRYKDAAMSGFKKRMSYCPPTLLPAALRTSQRSLQQSTIHSSGANQLVEPRSICLNRGSPIASIFDPQVRANTKAMISTNTQGASDNANSAAKAGLEKRLSYIPSLKKRQDLSTKNALSMSIEDHLNSYIQRKSIRSQGLR